MRGASAPLFYFPFFYQYFQPEIETGLNILRLLSAQQWLKNGLILIPAVFAVSDWSWPLILQLGIGIAGFSLLASAVYINNDVLDRELDRLHPVKKHRIVASGKVQPNVARFVAGLFFAGGTAVLFLLSIPVGIAGLIYVVINLFYSLVGKHIPVVDILCIIPGYLIRLWIGGEIAGAPLSVWVIIVVCLLAYYLVLIKRYGDVEVYRNTGKLTRKTVGFYERLPLKLITLVSIHVIAVVYLLYIVVVFDFSKGTPAWFAMATIPLVYVLLYRYNKHSLEKAGEDPITLLLNDYVNLSVLCISLALLLYTLYRT